MAGPGAHPVTLHHGLGRATALVVTAVGLPATWPGRTVDDVRPLAALLSLVCVLLAVGWRPAVVVGDDAVLLRNPWRDVLVPWPAVEDVRMRWTLEVLAAGRTHRAWAAPGPRRLRDTRDLDWTGDTLSRYAADAVSAAARAGHGSLGTADAALLTGQRWAARAALAPPGPVVVRPATASRLLLASGVLLGCGAALPLG